MWQQLCELETRGGFSSRAADFKKWDYIWMKVQSHLQTLVWTAEGKVYFTDIWLVWVHTSQFTSEPGLVKSLVISSACHRIGKYPARWEILAAGEVEKRIICHKLSCLVFIPVNKEINGCIQQLPSLLLNTAFLHRSLQLELLLSLQHLVPPEICSFQPAQLRLKVNLGTNERIIECWLYPPHLLDKKFRFILQKIWTAASAGTCFSLELAVT